MKKYSFIIFIFILSCAPTEPVEIHDDMSVLQDFINNSLATLPDSLDLSMDADGNGVIEPLELGEQAWNDNGRITLLNCYNIGLSGGIPENIGGLTELTKLGLKNNNLSSGIPESIGNLTNLTQLNLADNALSGSIPDTISNLISLTNLVLSNNEFSGSIPNSIGELSVLHTLLADSNSFSGSIPSGLCNIENLKISRNQFCDSQPSCIDYPEIMGYQDCSCSNDENKINGYCYLQSDLDVLQDFINNADSLNMIMDTDTLEGVQPLELGFQKWQSGRLKTLDCYWDSVSCHLSTEFPVNIINLDSLKYLDLQNNDLTGTIPDEISNLAALEEVYLQDNNLSGYLPENLCIDDTTIWADINLKNNQFCPCYPKCIENNIGTQGTSGCSYCNEGYTQICAKRPDTVTISAGDSLCFKSDNLDVLQAFLDSSLSNLSDSLNMFFDYNSNGTIDSLELGEQFWANGKLIYFDARNCGLSGAIPQNINSLDTLFYLNLSNNHLSDILPESIYEMTNLSALHLYGNNLSGEISSSICDLTNLDWEADEVQVPSSGKSYLFDNKFCPVTTGYPFCIETYVGEQDTTDCNE